MPASLLFQKYIQYIYINKKDTLAVSPLTAARSAAARRAEHGFSYSKLMHAQNQAGIVIDRKILSEIAVYEPCVMAPPGGPPTAALHPSPHA